MESFFFQRSSISEHTLPPSSVLTPIINKIEEINIDDNKVKD